MHVIHITGMTKARLQKHQNRVAQTFNRLRHLPRTSKLSAEMSLDLHHLMADLPAPTSGVCKALYVSMLAGLDGQLQKSTKCFRYVLSQLDDPLSIVEILWIAYVIWLDTEKLNDPYKFMHCLRLHLQEYEMPITDVTARHMTDLKNWYDFFQAKVLWTYNSNTLLRKRKDVCAILNKAAQGLVSDRVVAQFIYDIVCPSTRTPADDVSV